MLLLTNLRGVTVQNLSGIKAATRLCPLLQEIEFVSNAKTPTEDLITIEKLKSILSSHCWPKVLNYV